MTDSFRRRIRAAGQGGRDSGLTLVELLISMVLSLILAGVLVAAIVTSLNVAGATSDSIKTTVDVQLVSSYLARDAQGAAGTDPNTLQRPQGTGVSVTSGDWGGCSQPGTLIARFSWIDRLDIRTEREITSTWALNGAELSRLYCVDGEKKAAIVLGRTLVSAAAQCAPTPDCTGDPTTISLTVAGRSEKSTYTTTLSASLRARGQDTPTSASASTVAFLALGNGAATSPCTTVALATAKAYVVGDAVIADECGASAVTPTVASIEHPAFGSPAVTGLTSLTGNLQDPLALTPVPTGNCSGSNPAIGTPGNHPNKLSITAADGPVELLSGVYYLCNGLEIGAGASVVSGAGGVMFYLKGGTVTIDPAASVELTAIGTGDQKNILFWVSSPDQTLNIGTGDHVTRLGGTVYAPASDVVFSGSTDAAAVNVGVLIARTVTINSNVPVARFGPIPSLSISPSELTSAVIGQPYSAPLSVIGDGASQLVNPRWSATGLSPFSINSVTGEISGTPACALSLTPHVRVVDDTGLAVSADYSLLVLSDLSLASPGSYVSGTKTLTATLTDTCGGAGTSVSIQYWEEGGDTDVNGDPLWNTMCTTIVSPFSCSWVTTDTTKYSNSASYSLRATATLSNGTAATSDVIEGVTIDNGSPAITLNSPGALPLKGTVTLTADAYDAETGISLVKFEVSPAGLNAWMEICQPTAPYDPANQSLYACDWDTTAFVPSNLGTVKYDVRASTRDLAGNWASDSITNQSINNNGASISVQNPGAYVKGTVTIGTNPYVPSPATVTSVKIQYKFGSGAWTDICTDTTDPFSCSWNTTGLTDGEYSLQATMVDSRNATTTVSAIVTTNVDNSPLYGANVQAINGHYKYDARKKTTTITAGKIDGVDTLTLTYSKAVSPNSIILGWNGSLRSIFIRILDGQFVAMATSTATKTKDVMDFCTSWNSTMKGMQCSGVGTNTNPNLGKGTGLGYIALNSDFERDGWNATPSRRAAAELYGQISMSGAVVTIKIGSPCPTFAVGTTNCIAANAKATGSPKDSKSPKPSATMVWMPSVAAIDSQAGSECSTRPGPETGSVDRDF